MSSARELDDFLSTYLKYTDNTEPPTSYHIWTAISIIAGALQRKVYLNWGHDTIYPNMYIVLIGPSGRARKGTAMGIGNDIIKDIGIQIASESITREALIRDMKDAISQFTDASTGKIRFHCSITTLSEELSVFLGQNDIKFLADLTNWYDSRDSWTYRTKGSGTDQIQGVCFNLLGATAPDWLQSILPQEAVGGGFTSRIIFIVEEDKGKTVPEPFLTEDEIEMRVLLKRDLERIATLTGEMIFSTEAKEFYIAWYKKHEKAITDGKPPIDDPRFSGYVDRRATHIRKLSMIMSASRGMDRIITLEDIKRAEKTLLAVEGKMYKTFGGLGRSQYSEVTDKVIKLVQQKKSVKRSYILRTMYRDIDPGTLDIIETTMTQMKLVQVVRDLTNNEVIYKLKE